MADMAPKKIFESFDKGSFIVSPSDQEGLIPREKGVDRMFNIIDRFQKGIQFLDRKIDSYSKKEDLHKLKMFEVSDLAKSISTEATNLSNIYIIFGRMGIDLDNYNELKSSYQDSLSLFMVILNKFSDFLNSFYKHPNYSYYGAEIDALSHEIEVKKDMVKKIMKDLHGDYSNKGDILESNAPLWNTYIKAS